MADYYTHISFVWEDEPKVINFAFDFLDWLLDKNHENNIDFQKIFDASPALRNAIEDDALSLGLESDREGGELWFTDYQCEHVDIEALAEFICGILEHFDIDEPVAFEYANTCSKPRLDAYGGGAIICHKTGAKYCNSYDFIRKTVGHIKEHGSI